MAEQKKRTAIVTGASRGIGKAIAIRLAHDGYSLCLNDVAANESELEELVSEVKSISGREATAVVADVSSLSACQAMVKHSTEKLGPLDVMIANAGIAQVKALLELTEEDLRRMFEVNVFGVYNCYRAAAEAMIAQGGAVGKGYSEAEAVRGGENRGKIIGAASIVAFKPFAMLSHYSASKWAVRGLTQAMAMEMAEHAITVNAYAPGIVGTKMWDLIDEELGKKQGAQKGDTIKKYSGELIALGRTSVAEDVAKTVSFLAGPDSDYMTGQTLIIDGGIIMN